MKLHRAELGSPLMMEPENIRIAIAHRDRLYRDALSCALEQVRTISIVHTAPDLEVARDSLVSCQPDLLIAEFGLSGRKDCADNRGCNATLLRVKKIVIGVPNREEDILTCIEWEGAAGYLLMHASFEDLLSNIQAVMKGEALCSPRIASLAFSRVSSLARQSHAVGTSTHDGIGLTRREAEIVNLIDDGLSNKEIAVRLHIEVSTVKNHVHNILDKLQLHNRYSAVKLLKEQGIAISRA